MNDKIKELQKQIELEKSKMANCNHTFGKPFYNPDTKKEGYGSVQDGAGSDPHWSFEGYHDVEVPRWTRKCECGFEEHTYKRKDIVVGSEPDFNEKPTFDPIVIREDRNYDENDGTIYDN
jgi:hypothetical protein